MLWNEGDAFSLYDLGAYGTTTPSTSFTFTITDYSNASPSNSASFSGACNISTGNQIMALYPAQDDAIIPGSPTLSIPSAIDYGSGSDEEVGAGMAPYMFMYASGQMKGSSTSLNFNHMTSMIRITYQNQSSEEQSISEVKVTGDEAYFGTTLNFNLTSSEQLIANTETTIGATFDGLTVAVGDTLDVYLLFFPGDDFSESGSLTFSVEGQTVTYDTSVLQASGFSAGSRYWFNLSQTDNGLALTNNYAVYDDYVLIYSSVNARLCQVLADKFSKVSLDDGGNAIVPISLIESTTNLSLSNQSLTSLDGLECFVNLQSLSCSGNNLTSLNASCFPKLIYLYCYSNNLTSLDVSKCTALTTLYCYSNNLSSLDVSSCTSLESLLCSNNNLTSLDVSACTKLENLQFYSNNLTSIDVSTCTKLGSLFCYNNNLTDLDLSFCTSLKTLECYSNKLTSLDLSGFTSLKTLFCYSNNLISIDVSDCTSLGSLRCYYNNLTSLDISTCTSLSSLWCGNQYSDSTKSSYQYMVLYLTSGQESTWDSEWSTNKYNKYVTTSVID